MRIINLILAEFLDSLKVKNPTLWTFIAMAITGLFTAVTTGVDLGYIKVEADTPTANFLQILTFIAGLFLQSRTTSFINENESS